MRQYFRVGLLLLLASALTGCMHTRYAESNHFWNTGSQCSCGAEHHSMQKERRWSGLWVGQPDQVRP